MKGRVLEAPALFPSQMIFSQSTESRNMNHWNRKAAGMPFVVMTTATALFALAAGCGKAHTAAPTVAVPTQMLAAVPAPASSASAAPQWPASSVIYTLYPEIFSPQGNFAGVTAQLPRLKALGVTDVWVMPVTPIGQPINGHPSVDSPYDVHDYYGINPKYGASADLHTLIGTAHKLGMRVLLDEVLNHTAWDNALITQHPEYYVHSDSNVHNPASIKMAFTYSDVAQLDYTNPDVRAYMTKMLRFWVTEYKVDGFRFDSANNPDGPGRLIPADFWQQLGASLRQTKPDVLMLEEGEAPDLAHKPFALDYAWRMYDPGGTGALKTAADGDASAVEPAWHSQVSDFPVGMQHMAVQDDWDTPRDVNSFGGKAGAQAIAVFNFTTTGIPLIYNGMEIANAAGARNPHAPIKWADGDATFTRFYHSLIALRRSNPAFTTGAMTWLPNTAAKQLLTYTRTGGGSEFLVAINPTATAADGGKISAAIGTGWLPVLTSGTKAAALPLPSVSLPAHSFAVYRRPSSEAASAAERGSVAAVQQAAETAPGDNAGKAAYSNGYKAGENGGSGFLPFAVKTTGTAGTFVFSAAEAEGNQGSPPPASMDAHGKSFGLFAQSKDAAITITRGFAAPLTQKGDSFALDFVSGFNDAGACGVALTTAGGPVGSFVFHSSGVGVLFNDKPTGLGFVRGASHLVYTLTSPTAYSLTVTGAEAFSGTGTFTGPITGFQVQQTNSGSTKPDHNAYFNNLSISHAAK